MLWEVKVLTPGTCKCDLVGVLQMSSSQDGHVGVVLITQLGPTLCDPMGCSPPRSAVHGILQARILGWVAMPFSRGSSRPRDWTRVSCIASGFFTVWATREAHIGVGWAPDSVTGTLTKRYGDVQMHSGGRRPCEDRGGSSPPPPRKSWKGGEAGRVKSTHICWSLLHFLG